jgi:hypothetical protein
MGMQNLQGLKETCDPTTRSGFLRIDASSQGLKDLEENWKDSFGFLVGLQFELKVLNLQSRHSTT